MCMYALSLQAVSQANAGLQMMQEGVDHYRISGCGGTS